MARKKQKMIWKVRKNKQLLNLDDTKYIVLQIFRYFSIFAFPT